jgi:hypothetical protein
VCDTLAGELHGIDSALTFELGPADKSPRDFIISADGIQAAFPTVFALAKAAPPLPKWHIVRFRPPRPGPWSIEVSGVKVDGTGVAFLAEKDGDKTGVTLSIPGYRETGDHRYQQAAYLLLDGTIGEYAVEMQVGFIEFAPTASRPPGNWRPLADLPRVIDTSVP